jgi:succinate-semialdehyde dehydrogenase/glutarate-semialdehyde dehydrogenase
VLRDNVEEYAKMITLEMGKPIYESLKLINVLGYVTTMLKMPKNFGRWSNPTDAAQSFVMHSQ